MTKTIKIVVNTITGAVDVILENFCSQNNAAKILETCAEKIRILESKKPLSDLDPENSLVDFLKSESMQCDFISRKRTYDLFTLGVHEYKGTEEQNKFLLNILKQVKTFLK